MSKLMQLTVKRAKTYREKVVGLMGSKEAYPLLLQTRFGIHTLSLKFPIDVVILDDNYIVQTIKEQLKPNTFFLWNPKFSHVLELPAGEIKKKKISIGVKLHILEA